MTRVFSALCATVISFGVATASVAADALPQTSSFTASPLFSRMVHVNDRLRSYTARVHLDVAMHTFPFLSPELDGTAYYKQPDQNAIVFDTVPALASLFKKVFPRLDPPAEWPKKYDVYLLSDASGSAIVRLIPKKNGRVIHLDVTVDDQSALPKSFTYTYRDGGDIHFDQTLELQNGTYVPKTLVGHINVPSTKADASSTFSDYKINVPIPNSTFTAAP